MDKEFKLELETEIKRRWKFRNCKGYYGANARAWIRQLIKNLRTN